MSAADGTPVVVVWCADLSGSGLSSLTRSVALRAWPDQRPRHSVSSQSWHAMLRASYTSMVTQPQASCSRSVHPFGWSPSRVQAMTRSS
jgi:hypothetical protein